MSKYSRSIILDKPFIPIETHLKRFFIPLSTSTYLLDHEITAFFGSVSREVGRSIVENNVGFAIGAYHAQNLCVTFDGCLFTEDALLASDSLNFRESSRAVLAHFLEQDLTEILVEDPCVLLYGPGWTTWGHWTIEFLTRIYIIQRMGFDKNAVRWIIPSECPGFAREFIRMLGIEDDNLISFEHTRQFLRCRSIIVPTNLTCGMSCHPLMTDYIAWLRSSLGISAKPDPAQRLYLSRQKLESSRRVTNAGEVENVMRDHGYQVIYPEQMTVSEQIRAYSNAISIFSEYGSGSHNSIFASPQTFVGCLRDNKRSVGFVQSALCKAAGQKLCYVFGEHSHGQPHLSYEINLDDLQDSLRFAENRIARSILEIFSQTAAP